MTKTRDEMRAFALKLADFDLSRALLLKGVAEIERLCSGLEAIEACDGDAMTLRMMAAATLGREVAHGAAHEPPDALPVDRRPPWAIDPMNPHEFGGTCPDCGDYWEVVRPGKWQPHCGCYSVNRDEV